MTDRVVNLDVEDVLTSIRRLVSEKDRAKAAVAPVPAADESADDRLVLTPAFRVEETVSDAVEAEQTPEAEVAAQEIAEPENAEVDEFAASIEEAVQEVSFIHRQSNSASDASLEEKIAALEAAVGATRGNWEPDGSEGESSHRPTKLVVDPEAKDASSTYEWEDAGPAEFVRAAQPAATPEQLEAEEVPEDEHDDDFGIADPDPEPTPQAGADDLMLDEVALREMVAEIVRDELHGTLGERITRNVRRLVRREIQRAMTLKDFE